MEDQQNFYSVQLVLSGALKYSLIRIWSQKLKVKINVVGNLIQYKHALQLGNACVTVIEFSFELKKQDNSHNCYS